MPIMGQLVSIEQYRRARELRAEPGLPAVPDAAGTRRVTGEPVERLARAVRVLDLVLTEAMETEGMDETDIRRELVALNGAVAVGRYGMAAARTERLVDRLRRRSG